jgi:hypothetical protein
MMTNDQLAIRRIRHFAQIHDFTLRLIWLLAVHPGRVTSWMRSVASNNAAGGLNDSYHLDGCGSDVVLDERAQNSACVATARALDLDAVDEGDHVHVELDYRRRNRPAQIQS